MTIEKAVGQELRFCRTKKGLSQEKLGFENLTQGTLFFEIKRIIQDKRPCAFLLENVRNLKSHDGSKTFQICIRRILCQTNS